MPSSDIHGHCTCNVYIYPYRQKTYKHKINTYKNLKSTLELILEKLLLIRVIWMSVFSKLFFFCNILCSFFFFLFHLKKLVRTLFGYTQRSLQKASENKFKLLLYFVKVQEVERMCTLEDWVWALKDKVFPGCPTIDGSLKIFADWCSFTMTHHSYI